MTRHTESENLPKELYTLEIGKWEEWQKRDVSYQLNIWRYSSLNIFDRYCDRNFVKKLLSYFDYGI